MAGFEGKVAIVTGAARGTGADLMLAIWGRGTLEPLETFGDPELIAEWFDLTR